MGGIEQLADSDVVRAYGTYVTIVLLKMMVMSVITAFFRLTRKVFANPEDAMSSSKGGDPKKFVRTDPDVERVRRCHLNDIENIIPFVGIGLVYVLSNPDLLTALLHFRIFAGSRIFHTIAYLMPLPQPSRALSWAIGYAVTISMAYRVLQNILYL
ncbi:microsomal glutathione S-transferase 1 [Pelobates cultripes]|uniref:Microsomal glutathione S-transferase 1 n=1 Tax=Pelobates cultripes TaxID=61616 RepID=A0AAD1RUD0_PELCU|nr:microsomal glutathione S-transferase 1 [Pelobates cultripes]